MRRSAVLGALLATAFAVSDALADDARCLSAFESTQRLRKEGKLRAAREEALVCSATSCPDIVVRDCASWLGEIEAATPTVVFAATSGERELVDVEVLVDGASMSTRLDGRARALDPGAHHIRFVSPGHAPAEIEIVVAEGEKNRKVTANLVVESRALARRDEAGSSSRPIPATAWILGGASVVAFAGAAIFGVDALGKKSDLDALGCKPSCDADAISATTRSFVIADVLAVAGVVAAAASIFVYATQPAAPDGNAAGARRATFVF